MTKNTNAEILETFGKILMHARDYTIKEENEIIEGNAKGNLNFELQKKLESLSNDQKEGVRALVIDSIDGAINNFLWMIEQNSDEFDLIAYKDKKVISLQEISDGLCGDYWNFVDHYSHYQRLEELIGYDYEKAKELREKAFVENLAVLFSESPSAAKREFVKILNNNQKYEELKTKAHTLPPEVLRSLIEMTLSQSSFHEKECKELLEIPEHQEK